jgi:hypothetical protein
VTGRARRPRGDDDVVARGRVVVDAHLADAGTHRLGGERLAVELQPVAGRAGGAQQLGGGSHRRVGRGLRAAHALDLRLRLGASPLGEHPLVGDDLDAVGAQPVGDGHRQVRRHDQPARLEPPRRPGAQLGLDLVPAQPVAGQLVEAELVGVDDLDVGGDLGDPARLHRRDHGHAAAVALEVGEGIEDAERELVAEGSGAVGVPVNQDIGRRHGAKPTSIV